MSTARAERAAARRSNAIPGRIVQLGASKGRMYSGLSYEARLIAYWQLIERAWIASGRAMPSPRSRADLPGEVFEVERNAKNRVDFDEASREPVMVQIEGRSIPFIGRRALLTNKRAAGRTKDLADVEALESPEDE